MAELTDRYADNIAGRYFVDEQCIDCDLCREEAPKNFTRNEAELICWVQKCIKHKLSALQLKTKSLLYQNVWNYCASSVYSAAKHHLRRKINC